MLHLTTVQIGLLVPLQPYRFQGSDSLNGAILKGPKLFPEYKFTSPNKFMHADYYTDVYRLLIVQLLYFFLKNKVQNSTAMYNQTVHFS